MKILLVTDKMELGGAETHISTLAEGLLKRGLEVTLLSAGGALAENLGANGVRCVSAPLDKRNPKDFGKAVKIMRREMRAADVVHTHTRYSSFLAAYIRGKQKFPPIVTTAHLNFPLFPFGPLSFWGDRTLAVSEDIKDYLRKSYKIPEENIALTKNCIDTSIFGGERKEKKLIAHTSRIDTGRAQCAFMLTELAEELLSRHKGWRILIIGGGNLFGKLKRKVSETNRRLGFEGILLSGPVRDVASLLRYASVFVGVSRAALEAMSFGIPTVISGDEGYGGIVTADNISVLESTNFCARGLPLAKRETLMRDVEFLMENPDQRHSLSQFSRSVIVNGYSPEIMSADAVAGYRSARRAPSLCLMGYFGYGNLGDEETLRAAISLFRKTGIRDISVLCEGSLSGFDQALGVKRYDRMNPYSFASAVASCDIFVMCGGNLLQNETSTKSLLYYDSAIRFARRSGKGVYMLSSGIGDIKGKIGKMLLKRSISLCDRIAMRTGNDRAMAKKFVEDTEVYLMPDFCFLLPDGREGCDRGGKFAYIISADSRLSPDDLIKIASSRALLPIVISLYKNADKDVAGRFEAAGIKCFYPKNFESFKKAIQDVSFTVCDRLHGAVFSILSYTPAYISIYSSKNRAFLEEISSRSSTLCCKEVLMPLSLRSIKEKSEVGVTDSDFKKIIESLREDIFYSFSRLFC